MRLHESLDRDANHLRCTVYMLLIDMFKSDKTILAWLTTYHPDMDLTPINVLDQGKYDVLEYIDNLQRLRNYILDKLHKGA